MQQKKMFLSVFLIMFALRPMNAQVSLSALSADKTNQEGSVSLTIGQAFMQQSEAHQIREGVHQTYQISTLSRMETADIMVSVYPNPTTDALCIQLNGTQKRSYTCRLHAMDGKLLLEEALSITQHTLNTSMLVPAVYMLKIYDDMGQMIQTFKIVKTA